MQEPVRLWLLAAGALVGLVCAAFGLLEFKSTAGLPEYAAARVNDTVISKQSLGEALSRLQHDSRDPLDSSDEEWVLSRLIEEELLVQHGLALGLAVSEHNVRAAIVQSLITAATAEASSSMPDDAELEAFYTANRALFVASPAVALRVWTTTDAALAAAVVAGESGLQSKGLERVRGLPESMMPMSKIRDYLGPTLAGRISRRQQAGLFSETVADKLYVVQVLELEEPKPAPFASIRGEVLARYRQDLADRALREYIDLLRQRAAVVIAD
jgi:hypothetical protein